MPFELTRFCATPRLTSVDAKTWAAAAFIGGLRTASNERGRTKRQDRGALNNAVVDLQGVIGELLVLLELDEATPDWTLKHGLLHWDGGGGEASRTGVDVEIARAARAAVVRRLDGSAAGTIAQPPLTLRLETKSHLDLPPDLLAKGLKAKRDFAVNYEAVRDSCGNGAMGVIPVATVPGAALAARGCLLPLATIFSWDPIDYGYGHYALRVPLNEIAPAAWGLTWPDLQRRLNEAARVADIELLVTVHQSGFRAFAELVEDPEFDLASLSAPDAISLASRYATDRVVEDRRPAPRPGL